MNIGTVPLILIYLMVVMIVLCISFCIGPLLFSSFQPDSNIISDNNHSFQRDAVAHMEEKYGTGCSEAIGFCDSFANMDLEYLGDEEGDREIYSKGTDAPCMDIWRMELDAFIQKAGKK